MDTDHESGYENDIKRDANPAFHKRGRAGTYDGIHNKNTSRQVAMDVVTAPILYGIDTEQLIDWEIKRQVYEAQMNERAPGVPHMSYMLSMNPNFLDAFCEGIIGKYREDVSSNEFELAVKSQIAKVKTNENAYGEEDIKKYLRTIYMDVRIKNPEARVLEYTNTVRMKCRKVGIETLLFRNNQTILVECLIERIRPDCL